MRQTVPISGVVFTGGLGYSAEGTTANLLAKWYRPQDSSRKDEESNVPFRVEAGQAFYVPLSFLWRSGVLTGAKYLGKCTG